MPSKQIDKTSNHGLEPLVSIIILNFNGLDYLKRTIDSVFKIDYSNYEVIIVDNGSTDESIHYIEKYDNIKLIKNKKNLGFSQGKNIGIDHARGEFILSIDNDISLTDDQLLNKLLNIYSNEYAFIQVPLLDSNSKVTNDYGIYFSLYGLHWHKKTVSIDKILNYPEDTIEIAGPTGAFMFFNKHVWDKIGGFDQSQLFHLDDIDIGPRAYLFGYKNMLYTKSFVYNLGSERSRESKIYLDYYKYQFSGHARSIIKNYNKFNLIFRFPIFVTFQILKTIKYAIKYREIRIAIAFFASISVFVRKLNNSFKQRAMLQSKRVVKDDLYLKLKPEIFN
ncbi:glycosyltransferase family 2 protein [Patescibacteria group bacterium]|nr:glycosyltransferase family 2 protein [Patescibacteria group bacterium]MBU1952091.1 glycosyltransferase family 2 protein [Patescibacteria group bacterium]